MRHGKPGEDAEAFGPRKLALLLALDWLHPRCGQTLGQQHSGQGCPQILVRTCMPFPVVWVSQAQSYNASTPDGIAYGCSMLPADLLHVLFISPEGR